MKAAWTMTAVVTVGVLLTTTISLARMGTLWNWGSLSLDLPAEGEIGPAPNDLDKTAAASSKKETDQPEAAPVAIAEDTEFDFGVEKNKTSDHRHTFIVRNEGDAPLKFVGYDVSCNKCTFIDLPETDLAPSDSAKIVVRWNIDTFEDHFRQSASVQTNDPKHPLLRFVISGKVVRPLEIVPRELVLNNVQAGVPAAVKGRLFAYFSDDLQILKHSFGDPATTDFYEIETSPVAEADLPSGAKSGLELTVKLRPGLPLGSIEQSLQLTTNVEESAEAEIPIKGRVIGAVSLIGKGWEKDRNMLEIGPVKRSAGGQWKLTLVVRGPHREGLELEPPEHPDPDVLKITYGEPSTVAGGATTLIPLTFEIPPQSRLVSHMGGATGKLAEVTIPTNKPELGRVKLSVRFAVVDD